MPQPNRKDFDQKWAQGEWAEKRVAAAINRQRKLFALPFGPSGTAPEDRMERRLYFEKLQGANRLNLKRPDILVFARSDQAEVEQLVKGAGGYLNLSFQSDEQDVIRAIVGLAKVAVECEASLWRAARMAGIRDRIPLRPQRRLCERLGFAKSTKLPNIWIKKEDRDPLQQWQNAHDVPVHVWQFFFDRSYGISFDKAMAMVDAGYVSEYHQPYGEGTKPVYLFHPACTYRVADVTEEPTISATWQDKPSGQVVADLKFEGGNVALRREALSELNAPRFTRRNAYADEHFLNLTWPAGA